MKIIPNLPAPTWVADDVGAGRLATEVANAQSQGVKVALDTETTGLNIARDEVLFWSLCFDRGHRYCLPRQQLPRFASLLWDPSNSWWFTNAKFDMHMLENTGVKLMGKAYCTLVPDWLHDDTKGGMYGLKESMARHFNIVLPTFAETFGIRSKEDNIGEVLLHAISGADPQLFAKAVNYAASDAWATFKLGNYLETQLKDTGDWRFILDLYVPLTAVLYEMEHKGVLVDIPYLQQLEEDFTQQLQQVEVDFATATGKVVNMSSTKQLQQLFFGDLGRSPVLWTDGGKSGKRQPSLKEEALKPWADAGDPAAKALLKHRGLKQLISTFLKGLQRSADESDRVHTTFNMHVARTGRLSSSGPNLQNIPVRTDNGSKIRGAFIAPAGKTLLCLDYSQLEQVIMAHLCQDENMLHIIRSGRDIHSGAVAIMWPETTYEAVEAAQAAKEKKQPLTPEHKLALERRRDVKKTSFGINYGMGDEHLAKDLGIPLAEASAKKEAYLSQFPRLRQYVLNQHAFVHENLYVSTLLGRKRHLYGAMAGGENRAAAEREALNTPVQGGAADVVMLAMLRIAEDRRVKDLGAEMLLQVHDELLFEVPNETAKEAVVVIGDLMAKEDDRLALSVPLKADGGTGRNWLEAKG